MNESKEKELESVTISETKSQITTENYALWYTRAAAQVVDGLILSLGQAVLMFPAVFVISLLDSFSGKQDPSAGYLLVQGILQLISVALIFVYYGYFLSKEGATPGLKFLGIKVTKESGELLTFGQGILRTFLFSLLSLINMIMILVTQKRQGIHDLAVGTITVKNEEKTSRAKWIMGIYCGCGCLAIIISIIMFSVGIAAITSKTVLNKIDNKNSQSAQEMEQDELKNIIESDSMKEEKTTDTESVLQSDLYKACVNANKNPNLNLSDYCICATKEYSKGSNLETTIQNCKSLIKIN
jgi:uncharacterized RDD family membrane protein YckC